MGANANPLTDWFGETLRYESGFSIDRNIDLVLNKGIEYKRQWM